MADEGVPRPVPPPYDRDLKLADFDPEAAERRAEEALAAAAEEPPEPGGAPSGHLLSFYDRLHERVLEATQRHGGKLPEEVVKALLLVPDIFILLVRLMFDREVPRKTRALIAGVVAYFISPYDLLPEAILGPVGYLDDLVLSAAVLSQLFTGDLEPFARRHWNGPKDLHEVLRDINDTAEALLGHALYGRLQRLLARHNAGAPVDQKADAD
jgi:uncharacterized membrane protein YkvA (DUF1232 family)